MGETAADTRREIEHTRAELGTTISALRSRSVVVRGKVIRVTVVAAGMAVTAGSAVALAVVVRRRRGGALTQAARRLPGGRDAAVPVARRAERWADRGAQRARDQREKLVEAIAARVADNQAQAERRANPLWRRTAAKGLETAATVGMAALVRRAFNESTSRARPKESLSAPERELLGSGKHGPGVSKAADGAETEAVRTAG